MGRSGYLDSPTESALTAAPLPSPPPTISGLEFLAQKRSQYRPRGHGDMGTGGQSAGGFWARLTARGRQRQQHQHHLCHFRGFRSATSSQPARGRAPRCMPGALQQMWRGLLRRRIDGAGSRAANGICSRDCDKGSIDDKHPVLRSFPPQQAILAREAAPDVEGAGFSHTENEKWIHEKKYEIGLVSFAAGFS